MNGCLRALGLRQAVVQCLPLRCVAGWAFSAEGGGTTRLTVIFYISDFHERFTHYHAGEGLD